jgi:2-polyprenyl-3-methyl-5-hydroxy-6-metoxy-1,4-benzoquinol methylase
MTQYDKIATEYVANKMKIKSRENVEYHSFLHRLLLPALGIKDATKIDLKTVLAGQRVLDLGCGGGYYTREFFVNSVCFLINLQV